MEEEIWKDIKGWEGWYEVSNLGRVRSWKKGRFGRREYPIVLKPSKTTKGYLKVSFSKNNEMKTFVVHRLVAETFKPNPNNYPEVNHINEDKTDNRAENLEWCDRNYNVHYGTGILRNINKHINNPKRSKRVLQFNREGILVGEYPSTSEAHRQTGFNQGHIAECCRGERHYHKGFVWRFA